MYSSHSNSLKRSPFGTKLSWKRYLDMGYHLRCSKYFKSVEVLEGFCEGLWKTLSTSLNYFEILSLPVERAHKTVPVVKFWDWSDDTGEICVCDFGASCSPWRVLQSVLLIFSEWQFWVVCRVHLYTKCLFAVVPLPCLVPLEFLDAS